MVHAQRHMGRGQRSASFGTRDTGFRQTHRESGVLKDQRARTHCGSLVDREQPTAQRMLSASTDARREKEPDCRTAVSRGGAEQLEPIDADFGRWIGR